MSKYSYLKIVGSRFQWGLALAAALLISAALVQAQEALIVKDLPNGEALARLQNGEMVVLGELCEGDLVDTVEGAVQAAKKGEQQTDLPSGTCFWHCNPDCTDGRLCTARDPEQTSWCTCRYVAGARPKGSGGN